MPASESTTVDAGGRELRVTNPGRVIFPETERTAAVSKLDVVNYYLSVEDGIMRALARRPTTLERWTSGVHPGVVLSTRQERGGDAFFQKRVPKGAPDYVETARIEFPSGRHADEICPSEIAVVGWAAQMGTITFHPWPVRSADVDHPDELRLDLDPQPGTDFADAVRVAAEARVLLDDLGYVGFPKTSGGRGHPHLRAHRAALDVHRRAPRRDRVRARARAPPAGPGDHGLVEGAARRAIFVDYNQNARDRTIASAYSVRPKPGAPVSAPLAWDELPEVAARGLHRRDDARALRRGRRPRTPRSTTRPTRCSRCSTCTSATRPRGSATCRIRRTIRRCRASRSACSPRATRDRPRD